MRRLRRGVPAMFAAVQLFAPLSSAQSSDPAAPVAQSPIPVTPGPTAPPPSEAPPEPPPEPTPPPQEPPTSQAAPRLVPEIERDAGVEPTTRKRVRRLGQLALELDLGMNVRLGETSAFGEESTLGAAYGGTVWLNWFEHASFGLELQHTELGRGSDRSGPNLTTVEFAATTASLTGRFVPIRTESVDGFVSLRAGLAVQHVDADGVRQERSALLPPRSFSCTELDGPGMAFGGGVGARFGLGTRLSLLTRLDANAYQLSGEALGDCAVGVGSTASVSLGLGLAYEFGPSEPVRAQGTASRGPVSQTW